MATPTSTPRPHAAPSRPTPRSNNTAVHTPTPIPSVTSPPTFGSTPATLRSIASPAHLRSNLAKASPLSHALGNAIGSVNMSRNPTGASEAGTNGSMGALDTNVVLMEKTGLTPAGMGLGIGLSPLGGGQVGTNGLDVVGVQDQEEVRRKKTEDIVNMVGTRWGRVCQEGLERAAKRVGLECLWEEGRAGKRTLSIAGKGLLVDVEFHQEEVNGVTLEYIISGPEVGKTAPEGAGVLKRDLRGDKDGGSAMLDRFVGNLERLAKMDKLSEGGVSCFDAVEGIRTALQALFDLEVGKSREEKGIEAAKEAVDRAVLCYGSGRPMMHTRACVGLALQYWMDRSSLLPETEPEAMDVDYDPESSMGETEFYSAVIETEASLSNLYPPIRISDSWLGSPVHKAAPAESDPFLEDTTSIDWQDPPPTYLTTEKSSGDEAMNPSPQDLPGTDRLPNVRFIAKFEPPIVVPLQIAANIYQTLGAPLTQESIQATTYETLLFTENIPQDQRSVIKQVTSYDVSGNPKKHRHQYTLFSLQPDYGRTIESLPFSHPRQLVEVLPLLRQWALTGSLLRRSFTPGPSSLAESKNKTNGNHANEFSQDASLQDQSMTVEEELAALLEEPPFPTEAYDEQDQGLQVLPVDVTLSTTSSPPRIGVVWLHDEGLKSVDFTIGLNGVIEVSSNGEEDQQAEKIKKVLGIAEDIGVLIEWMNRK